MPRMPPEHNFVCEVCGKRFNKPSRLKIHFRIHTKERPFVCQVENCNYSYARKEHLKRHEQNHHPELGGSGNVLDDRVFKCSEEGCLASFASALSLHQHKMIKHHRKNELGDYLCTSCPERFHKKWALKEHQVVHTKEDPFKCSKCLETFSKYADFRKHSRSKRCEPNEPKYRCQHQDCTFSSDAWKALQEHIKCHPKEFKCDECGKAFKAKCRLRNHEKTHTDEEIVSVYKCPKGCERQYRTLSNLNHHIKSKHEGVSYACEICDKKLCTKQKLRNHIEVIHNNKGKPRKRKVGMRRKTILSKLVKQKTKDERSERKMTEENKVEEESVRLNDEALMESDIAVPQTPDEKTSQLCSKITCSEPMDSNAPKLTLVVS